MTNVPYRISLIGAGKLAWHLGHRFVATGMQVTQVCSRRESAARELASQLNAQSCTALEGVKADVDAIILAVPDDAIESVAERLAASPGFAGQLVVHTSGATGLDILQRHFRRAGVLYPLQTFSGKEPADFREIPVIVQGTDEEVTGFLQSMGSRLSSRCVPLDEEQRRLLHLAAVFVNNFTNSLAEAATEILSIRQLPLSLLYPLLTATVDKIRSGSSPRDIQTGPATRGDSATMERHRAYLRDRHPHLEPVYSLLSSLIRLQKTAAPPEIPPG
jgi:predicted short-subunit dehydrogenase-like oxidoreductase (DUF2520 family)